MNKIALICLLLSQACSYTDKQPSHPVMEQVYLGMTLEDFEVISQARYSYELSDDDHIVYKNMDKHPSQTGTLIAEYFYFSPNRKLREVSVQINIEDTETSQEALIRQVKEQYAEEYRLNFAEISYKKTFYSVVTLKWE